MAWEPPERPTEQPHAIHRTATGAWLRYIGIGLFLIGLWSLGTAGASFLAVSMMIGGGAVAALGGAG
jgi:hypothetical protein